MSSAETPSHHESPSPHERPARQELPTAREVIVSCEDEAAVARFAQKCAAVLPSKVMLAIDGDLGAGKTTFVKKLAAAVGINPSEVTSPTFTLVHLHQVPAQADRPALPPRLVHIDAYRLTGLDDLATLGWEELVDEDGWLAVEWPERIAAALPTERLELHLEITGESARRLHLRATGSALQKLLADVAAA
jgi:tRNA threonylcarbamoyladenosine biosynthesis protein TsaE